MSFLVYAVSGSGAARRHIVANVAISTIDDELARKISWGYIKPVRKPQRFSYDPAKDARSRAERSLSFNAAREFEFETAVIAVDDRRNYGEVREVALGLMGERVHVLVFTMRGEVCHVISFRKANRREIEAYVQALR